MAQDGNTDIEDTHVGAPDETVDEDPARGTTATAPPLGRDVPVPGGLPSVAEEAYRLEIEVARGGLGKIMRAWDPKLSRVVAIKQLLSPSKSLEARFIREARLTAKLQHPSIVPIYDAGRFPSGHQFYAMKLVEGRSLTEEIDDQETSEERLTLLPHVIDVAEAIAFAHSKHIIHRDLKPSNVLVGPFGETVVIDWGLAKDLSDSVPEPAPIRSADRTRGDRPKSLNTSEGSVLGTPRYMPPEQAAGETVDERADVYSLGAILYETLTGRAPYDDVSIRKVLDVILERGPTPIAELAPGVPADLAAIVSKAMARKKERRYRNAGEMAEELRRYTNGKLVSAHSYSPMELVARFVARYRAAVMVALLAALVLVVGGTASVIGIRDQRNRAEAAAREAEETVNELVLERARSLLDSDPTMAVAWLKGMREVLPGAASVAAEAARRGVAERVLRGHDDLVSVVRVSPDGRFVASAGNDPRIRLWPLDGGPPQVLVGHTDRVPTLEFDATGERLASGSYDGTVRLWSVATGQAKTLAGHGAPVMFLRFAPQGDELVSMDQAGSIRRWDLGSSGSSVHNVPLERSIFAVFCGSRLVTGSHGGTLRVWEGEAVSTLAGHQGEVRALVGAGDLLISAGDDGTLRRWDLASGTGEVALRHGGPIRSLALGPRRERVAWAGLDGTVGVLEVATQTATRLGAHTERVEALTFSPDGQYLVSTSWDRTARLWDLATGEQRSLRGHAEVVSSADFTPDGARLVTGSWDRTVRVWPVERSERAVLPGHTVGVRSVAFSPDGQRLVSGGHDDTVRLWRRASALHFESERVLRGHQDHVYRVLFSPDGTLVASSSDDRTVRLWDVATGEARVLEGHGADVEELAFSPDGRWLASGGEDDRVGLWTVETGAVQWLEAPKHHVTELAFSPDGARLAAGSRDGLVHLFEVQGGAHRALAGHRGEVLSLAFTARGDLISVSTDGQLRRLRPGAEGERLYRHLDGARRVVVSPDGKYAAVAGTRPAIWLCSLEIQRCDELAGHRGAVRDLAFSPDGSALISASGDQSLRIWDVGTHESVVLDGHAAPVFDVDVDPSGHRVASASGDATIRVWPLVLPPNPSEIGTFLNELSLEGAPTPPGAPPPRAPESEGLSALGRGSTPTGEMRKQASGADPKRLK